MKKIALIIFASIFLSGCNRMDQHQPFTDGVSVLSPGGSIIQEIESSYDNLNTISICLRNPSHVTMPLTFKLTENNQVIRTLDFSSANIDNADCTKFKFVPVEGSAGRSYLAVIESILASTDQPLTTSITVEKSGTQLHYKTFYYQTLSQVISESVSQFYSRLFLDPWFLICWLGIVILIVFKLIRSKSEF